MVVRIIILCLVFLLVVLFFTFVPMGLWISAVAANVKVGIFNLVGMKLRRVVPKRLFSR